MMNLNILQRTEADIVKNWQLLLDAPLVSIVCITYNHDKYITQAIESFLLQETSFPFEIIVHDDASTDSTAEIIQKYASRYPKIIKPILQKTNLYRHKINPLISAVSYAAGQFIALCEGDDYWTDSQKLQIQMREMKKYPDCELSFHPVMEICAQGNTLDRLIAVRHHEDKLFTTESVILGRAGFCQTSSLIITKALFDNLPKWFFQAPVSDYFLQMLGSLKGGALYINRPMSVYRIDTESSWLLRMATNEEYAYNYFIKMMRSLEDINIHTHNQYSIEFTTMRQKLLCYGCRNPLLSLQKRRAFFREYKNILGLKDILKWYIFYNNTFLCHWLGKLEKKIRKRNK